MFRLHRLIVIGTAVPCPSVLGGSRGCRNLKSGPVPGSEGGLQLPGNAIWDYGAFTGNHFFKIQKSGLHEPRDCINPPIRIRKLSRA